VKTAINEYAWEVLGIEDGFEGLIKPNKAWLLDITDVRGLLPRGGTMLGSTNRTNPFHYEGSTNGEVKVFDVSETVLHRGQVYGIDVLLVIGGDGTMRIAQELIQKGLQVVGVPKTIDNNLYGTEVPSALTRRSRPRWRRWISCIPPPKATTACSSSNSWDGT